MRVSLERLELSPTASEAGTLSIALQGLDANFTMFRIKNAYEKEGKIKQDCWSLSNGNDATTAFIGKVP